MTEIVNLADIRADRLARLHGYLRNIPLYHCGNGSVAYLERHCEQGQPPFWTLTVMYGGDGGATTTPIPTELEARACLAIVAKHMGATIK